MTVRSPFAARAKERQRARARNPPRAERRAKSLRHPTGPTLTYLIAVRRLSAAFAAAVERYILPEVDSFAKQPAERTDAADGDARDTVNKARKALVRATAKAGAATGDVAAGVARHSKSEFKRLGIKIRKAEPSFDRLISTWRSDNVSRVKSLVSDELQKLQEILREGEGRRAESLAKDIEERIGITARKAELLARDQVLTLNSQISHHRMQSAGVTRAIWVSTRDERTRESHLEADGEEFDIASGLLVDGEEVRPGEPINCRCTSMPILPELEDDHVEAARV